MNDAICGPEIWVYLDYDFIYTYMYFFYFITNFLDFFRESRVLKNRGNLDNGIDDMYDPICGQEIWLDYESWTVPTGRHFDYPFFEDLSGNRLTISIGCLMLVPRDSFEEQIKFIERPSSKITEWIIKHNLLCTNHNGELL